ncbi:MAG TPA: glycolate oxidase subunit GlcE [Burkholderiales bacterium]|nr:glycolate oxidase subunit GlcE [Burkholderiales bacterium]
MQEALARLAGTIREAAEKRRPLCVRGGGTKDFYGGEPLGDPLETRGLSGIVSYEPSELVVTARGGTPLAELESALAANGQMLAFEPPHFGAGATLGGCIAAGLAGPRRAAAGAVRDFVLGARLIDGRGRVLAFGGQVMKNVAGYDVSRLVTGSLGTLGVIAEVSLKVLPKPAAERTVRLQMPEAQAIEQMNRWAAMPLSISASAWGEGRLTLRLSGAESALQAAARRIGGERVEDAQAAAFWQDLREQRGAFFGSDGPLWRLSVPPASAPLELPGTQLIEWNGALRWWKTDAAAGALREAAQRAGGHATLFRSRERSQPVFTELPPVLARLHKELKAVFDPAGILNRGRLYAGF